LRDAFSIGCPGMHADITTTQRYADYAPRAHEVDFVNAAFAEPNPDPTRRAGTVSGTKLHQTGPNADQLRPADPVPVV